MTVLIIGLGSIGRRHADNLKTLLGSRVKIMAYRTRELFDNYSAPSHAYISSTAKDEHTIQTYPSLDQALAQDPVAVFITNPSSLHVWAALKAARSGCHLFIEKPISQSMNGLDVLASTVQEKALQVGIGFQFRFHPCLRIIKNLLGEGAIGLVVSSHAHWGEYLPNWHPGEDYRQGYSARADLGGGVLLTLCHPFDYLRWLLGEVADVSAALGRLSGLELDVEDSADVTLRFQSGAIGTVHLDYVQRPAAHWLHIIGQSGTIEWDDVAGSVRLYRAGKGEWEVFAAPVGFERNTMFVDEIRHFLDCIAGRASPLVTLEDGIRNLSIVLAAKRSTVEGRVIEVSNA